MDDINILKLTINQLNNKITEKDTTILELNEKINHIENEKNIIENYLGNETLQEEKDMIESAEPSAITTYQEDVQKEDRMIEIALQINKLQYEIGELFKDIKQNIKTDKTDEYKKNKKLWYEIIDSLYENYIPKTDDDKETYIDKNELFDKLILILKKQKKSYIYDEELKYLV
jgi:hypothetical protein